VPADDGLGAASGPRPDGEGNVLPGSPGGAFSAGGVLSAGGGLTAGGVPAASPGEELAGTAGWVLGVLVAATAVAKRGRGGADCAAAPTAKARTVANKAGPATGFIEFAGCADPRFD
jgi:hypothetical protein